MLGSNLCISVPGLENIQDEGPHVIVELDAQPLLLLVLDIAKNRVLLEAAVLIVHRDHLLSHAIADALKPVEVLAMAKYLLGLRRREVKLLKPLIKKLVILGQMRVHMLQRQEKQAHLNGAKRLPTLNQRVCLVYDRPAVFDHGHLSQMQTDCARTIVLYKGTKTLYTALQDV